MANVWYREALEAIDQYAVRLDPDQIEFVAALVDGGAQSEFTEKEKTVIRTLLARKVAAEHRPPIK